MMTGRTRLDTAHSWDSLALPALAALTEQMSQQSFDVADTTDVPAVLGLSAYGVQRGDTFVRALLAEVLAQASTVAGNQAAQFAAAEAERLITLRRADGMGWNYFPGIAEMPPDTDTLAAVTLALLLPGRRDAVDAHARRALDCACQECASPDGALPTWIVPAARRAADGRLRPPWDNCLWDGPAADVMPSLLYALHAYDSQRYESWLASGASYLESTQGRRGRWAAPFYCDHLQASYVCLRFLGACRPASSAIPRALDAIREAQQADGGWSGQAGSTAIALLALAAVPGWLTADDHVKAQAARRYLENTRRDGGTWAPHPYFWGLWQVGAPAPLH